MLRVRVIGAAAGGGFPQWNANSEACRRARAGDPAAPAATQASIAVSVDGAMWFLVNASPDLRQQIEANPFLHPSAGLRSSPIAGVILTNAEVDAIAGLLHLREGTRFTIYAPPEVLAILDRNPIFSALHRDVVPRRELRVGEWQMLALPDGRASGLEVMAFRVPGKEPLYLEGDASGLEDGEDATVALEFRAGEHRLIYAANCAFMKDDVAARLAGASVVFFDGTLFTDDEMIRQQVGKKSGRRMGHMSLSGPEGSMAQLRRLGIRRPIFIHINNTNPILLRDSTERRQVEAAGFEIAYDGMEVSL
jgi:pyrroloquinoline quinone biosynthesis protein B